MGQSVFPEPSTGTSSQLPPGMSQVIIDGTLAPGASKTVTATLKAGTYLLHGTAGTVFTTSPTSYTATVTSYSTTPTLLIVNTDQTGITVTNTSNYIAAAFTMQNSNGYINTGSYGLAYGNGRVVCTRLEGSSTNYTLDGRTWQNGGNISSGINWAGTAYGAGVFCTVGYLPTSVTWTSPDGITWTQRAMATSANYWGLYFGGGLFVASAWGPSTVCNTSPDGITWTARTLPNANWYIGWYGNGVHVQLAGSTTTYVTSTDGATWTTRTTLPSSSVVWNGGCYGEKHVAISGNNNVNYATSPDAITWTARTFPVAPKGSIVWDGTTYWVGCYTGNNIMTSTDAITWTVRTQSANIVPSWAYYPGIGIIGQGYIIAGSNSSFGAYSGTSTLG